MIEMRREYLGHIQGTLTNIEEYLRNTCGITRGYLRNT